MSNSHIKKCFMCGGHGCDCEFDEQSTEQSDEQSIDPVVNVRLTQCLQATRDEVTGLRKENRELTQCLQDIRAEVTGLRKDNRELLMQHGTREDEITTLKFGLTARQGDITLLKAALAETSTRLQAFLQESVRR
jgi:chromosome segregation ATPase